MGAPSSLSASTTPPSSDAVDDLLPVLGDSMAPLVARLRAYSRQQETLLLCGPTGVGKTRLARWCHEQSRRAHGPFEVVDLNSVPEELQLGHLFGWRRGAFTSAVTQAEGACGRATGGTLFIDEIDKLSSRTQAGLLEVLEQRTYRPLGMGGQPLTADVRFLIGTNIDLKAAVLAKRFREDLFYRINVLSVRVPPLSERRDEVISWARYMLRRRHRESGGPVARAAAFSPQAEQLLESHDWPGNLRELDNTVRRAYAIATTDIDDLQPSLMLSDRHIQDAMDVDSANASTPVLALLDSAAKAFVVEARRRHQRGQILDLDLLAAIRGFALGAARAMTGSIEDTLDLFGRGSLLANRNHYKFVASEVRRVENLCTMLGEPLPAILDALAGKDARHPSEGSSV